MERPTMHHKSHHGYVKYPKKSHIPSHHTNQLHQQQQSCSFKCNVCMKDLQSEAMLREHEEMHVTPYCSICNKMFKSLKLLRLHLTANHQQQAHQQQSKEASKDGLSSSDEELNICEDLSLHKVKEEPIELVSEPEIENLLNHDTYSSSSSRSSHKYYPEPSKSLGIWRNFTETPPSAFIAMEHSSVPLGNIKVEPADESDQFDFIINEILKKPGESSGGSKMSLVAEEIPLQQNFWTQSDSQAQTQQENWTCDICNKMFSTKQILQRHRIAVHDHNKDFKCDQCDQWFSSSNNHELIKHVNEVHNGFKKFICDYMGCNKDFSRKDALKRHRSTHDQKTKSPNQTMKTTPTYNCLDCGLQFKYQTSLLMHLKNHKV